MDFFKRKGRRGNGPQRTAEKYSSWLTSAALGVEFTLRALRFKQYSLTYKNAPNRRCTAVQLTTPSVTPNVQFRTPNVECMHATYNQHQAQLMIFPLEGAGVGLLTESA